MSNSSKKIYEVRRKQAGFTIVELMVAMVIGILVAGGVGAMFVQGSKSHAEDDRFLRMIENGRFAVDIISRDLRMTTFWGEMLDSSIISASLTVAEDCGLNLFDGAEPVLFNNPNASPALVQFDITSDSCPSRTGTVRTGTSQLVVKHTRGMSATSGQEENAIYLRTNGVAGDLIQFKAGTTAALASGFQDWEFSPSLYYIRDEAGTPYLCRLDLTGLGFGAKTAEECLAKGVEQINVQFGIDTDDDAIPNQYKSNPSAAEMPRAVTARLHVLVRSASADPFYTNTKTYVLGDLNVAATNDNFYRRVFTTTIALRNPANLRALSD